MHRTHRTMGENKESAHFIHWGRGAGWELIDFTYHHAIESTCTLTIWLPDYRTRFANIYDHPISPSIARCCEQQHEVKKEKAKEKKGTPAAAVDVAAAAGDGDEDKNMLPSFAHTCVGVGGVVLNSKGEILLIQEHYSDLPDYWKLPGGATDRGEELTTSCIREVKEETGCESQFISLLGVRHMQQYRWGCSDLYFVCLMKPRDEEAKLHAQAGEVAKVKWFPLLEFLTFESSKRFFTPLKGQLLRDLDLLYPRSAIAASSASSSDSSSQPSSSSPLAVRQFPPQLEEAIANAWSSPTTSSSSSSSGSINSGTVGSLSPRRSNEIFHFPNPLPATPSGLLPHPTPSWNGKTSSLYYTSHRSSPMIKLASSSSSPAISSASISSSSSSSSSTR